MILLGNFCLSRIVFLLLFRGINPAGTSSRMLTI